jgi:DNA-directed RNA polymerase specialized sigma24 family protein
VVLRAFNSFYARAKQGKFRQLEDSEDLWQLLLIITQRKAINRYKLATRYQKLVAGESSAVGRSQSSAAGQLARRADSSPAPELVASFTDNCRHLLDLLGDDSLRSVALWKMEGYTNAEIAKKLDTATRTVERKLRSIRTIWSKEFPH